MTPGEQQQLVEFIGRKFDVVNGAIGGLTQRLTRVEVLHEEQGHRLQIVAEGLTAFREESNRRFEQVDRRFEQVDRRFAQVDLALVEVRGELRSIHTDVAALAQRMDGWDERR